MTNLRKRVRDDLCHRAYDSVLALTGLTWTAWGWPEVLRIVAIERVLDWA